MGLDTSWTDSHPLPTPKKKNLPQTGTTNKPSNPPQQTGITDTVAAITSVLNTGVSLVNTLTSVVNTGINAYRDIQLSKQETRRLEILVNAYVEAQHGETERFRFGQEQETVRYLATIKADLEVKRLELEKFKLELAEQRANREFKQEQWRRRIATLEKIINPMIDAAEDVRKRCFNSNFANENDYAELKRLDETLFSYAMQQLKELYR